MDGWWRQLVRVLDEISEDDPRREVYEQDLVAMCEALTDCRREDGFWNVSLHDQTNFGGKELTGTALFCLWYGMGRQKRIA